MTKNKKKKNKKKKKKILINNQYLSIITLKTIFTSHNIKYSSKKR